MQMQCKTRQSARQASQPARPSAGSACSCVACALARMPIRVVCRPGVSQLARLPFFYLCKFYLRASQLWANSWPLRRALLSNNGAHSARAD